MKDLTVLIVGAGIGGLQTVLALAADGYKVTVLESVKEFLEVGAGIRVPPNSSRLSLSCGVDLDSVKKEVSLGNRFVDWHGTRLLDCPFYDMRTLYGAPYYFIHRADLIAALVSAVNAHANITLYMDTPVAAYHFEAPAVTTASGERLSADLVVCADGIKSAVRSAVNGEPVEPVDTGDVAYRILVPAAPLLADPEMRHLVENAWVGHAVGYPLRGGQLYNVIIDVTHGTDLGAPIGLDELRSEADNAHLVARFADWFPELADFAQLGRWVHPAGCVTLLGDSCHPMMPYLAQGAAQATEDAATLAACARRSRRYVARNTRVLQEWLHLHDGPEKERRDELMRHDTSDNPVFWAHSARRDWIFGHDATALILDAIPALPSMPHPEASMYKDR
ncbi:hypothetical protein B0H17DRAFT_1160441 [Mycena rosella]|uniref:FAD-binding domain-containing protein n=1 Tax=Mycena rosella TaxID=1033263 RepID=A0AAD7DBK6_MYCRO|nr:hypothetical protein B0H17DRAFT_1160441 [Mycena rosella]